MSNRLQLGYSFNKQSSILECVPNFSEGRNTKIIEQIATSIRKVKGQALLHQDSNFSANRTVFTFAGEPEAVCEAAYQAILTASRLIDMRQQSGVHPRVGATDVCPLIPLKGITIKQAVEHSEQLAKRLNDAIGLPIYLYEHSSNRDHLKYLPDIRKGEYEVVINRINHPEWVADFPFQPSHSTYPIEKTGITIIGVRNILVAFNISLNTNDPHIAQEIAKRIRTSGYWQNIEGKKIKQKGIHNYLRAIGWYIDEFETAQVSMNLLNYKITSPLSVWQSCKDLAECYQTSLKGSEVIGLIPQQCIIEAGELAFKLQNSNFAGEPKIDDKNLIEAGINYLGLDKIKPFSIQEKILEKAIKKHLDVNL